MSTTVVNTPGYRRRMLAREARRLRDEGMLNREIAEALGVSVSYASELIIDPDGTLAKRRKRRYAQPCVDCGAPTSGCEGRRVEPRCGQCAAWRSAAARRKWTPEMIIARIQEWARIYGEPPAIPDWNPWMARNSLHDEARAQRWEDAGSHWPWFNIVYHVFGSWGEGLLAAGFEPRQPDGGGGNIYRRRDLRARYAVMQDCPAEAGADTTTTSVGTHGADGAESASGRADGRVGGATLFEGAER